MAHPVVADAWATVGRVIARVVADRGAGVDSLEGLSRIGIDEISHLKGHNDLTVIVDHDSGRLVWIKPGRSNKTVAAFFDTSATSGAPGSGWSAPMRPT